MPGPTVDTEWARWLSKALDKHAWSAAELARTGVASESTISKWLRGANPPGLVETVIEVAHVLGEPDAIDALDAAGMHRAAQLIRDAITDADEDPMIRRIRGEQALTPAEREAMVEGYQRAQAQTLRLFELELAEAARRRHAERDRRTRREPPPQRAAQ